MNLVRALRLSSSPKLVFVGSGGKTTSIFRVAHELQKPVVVTTTTHLAIDQIALADYHYVIESVVDLNQLHADLPEAVFLVTGKQCEDNRVFGLSPSMMGALFSLAQNRSLPLLVEADGSQMRPLKAPAEHEPAIPQDLWKQEPATRKLYKPKKYCNLPGLDAVVVVAGLSGLGKPLSGDWVHRPDQFALLSGLLSHEPISIQGLARVLVHPQGGMKNIPPQVRRIALLNQADTLEDQSLGTQLAADLLPEFHSVVIASLAPDSLTLDMDKGERKDSGESEVISVHEPVAGVVLAAGGSYRLGRPKQLLDWRGKTLIRHVVEIALNANLSPVIVVLGAYSEEIRNELLDFPVILVNNEHWEQGQSTSVRVSLEVMTQGVGAAVFLLVDQPRVSPSLIRSLVDLRATSLDPIVAPLICGKRGNPVLFDQETFADLKTLQGDIGGRALFERYPLTYLIAEDAHLMLDIDTEEDYRELLLSPD